MKRCPYCGKEYPDEATLCAIDREPLVGDSPESSPAETSAGAADKSHPFLTFPDYKWSARDAWKCIGMIVVLQFVLGTMTAMLSRHFSVFSRWGATGFGFFFFALVNYAVFLLVAAFFARTETLATFWKGFGLDRKPSEQVWNGIVAALVLRFIGVFIITHGWGSGVKAYDIAAFRQTPGPERYFFLMPLLALAPLFEESVNRGFLYKAFRGSRSIGSSMAFIVAWTAFTHWSQYSHSWVAVFDLSIITLVQCYLREKSDSLWDCIICHAAFNGSLLFLYGTYH